MDRVFVGFLDLRDRKRNGKRYPQLPRRAEHDQRLPNRNNHGGKQHSNHKSASRVQFYPIAGVPANPLNFRIRERDHYRECFQLRAKCGERFKLADDSSRLEWHRERDAKLVGRGKCDPDGADRAHHGR